MNTRVFGVCGAGTMGSGIAFAAALAGYEVQLYDVVSDMLQRGRKLVEEYARGAVERGKIDAEEGTAVMRRVRTTASLNDLRDSSIVVEAVVERLEVKQSLFQDLESIVATETILASNTSSLSITAIAAALHHPERCVGMHFFNPAHVMKLVEVVEGYQTAAGVIERTAALARELSKTPVLAKDTPGFIVNRVARNFYGEALRIVGEGAATGEQVDRCMRRLGFRMGPFELMDLIGIDVNLLVTESVYDQYFNEPRFRPHLIQKKMVEAGRLGKKSGGGFRA